MPGSKIMSNQNPPNTSASGVKMIFPAFSSTNEKWFHLGAFAYNPLELNNRILVYGSRNLRSTKEDTSACGSGESFPWRISIACMA